MCSRLKNSRAVGYALRLLKFRPRSEYELRQRLKQKGFDENNTRQALIFLQESGLLDDREFARMWVESRLKRPLGYRRIKQELKSKGIGRDLIEQVIKEVSLRHNEEQVLEDLIQRRWEKLKQIGPVKARRRLFLYLLHRGFSPEMIQQAMSNL